MIVAVLDALWRFWGQIKNRSRSDSAYYLSSLQGKKADGEIEVHLLDGEVTQGGIIGGSYIVWTTIFSDAWCYREADHAIATYKIDLEWIILRHIH